MKKYDPKTIEPKWQQIWEQTKLYRAVDGDDTREKYYYLMEFPYPSGEGLHVGHVLGFTALDIMARHKRMQGYNVLYPIGFDEFGLPTENFAIKHKIAPQLATERNVANFRRQFKALGLSFDWDREVHTSDPSYYKWTQWIFLQLLKRGLAYQSEMPINWCPHCKTGLANEEVVDGKHERCGTPVEKKLLNQWLLKITAYADRLIEDLKGVDYLDRIAAQQINWIGRSEGAEIEFALHPHTDSELITECSLEASRDPEHHLRWAIVGGKLLEKGKQAAADIYPDVVVDAAKALDTQSYVEAQAALRVKYGVSSSPYVKVYTTRPDTLFGATFLVASPELTQQWIDTGFKAAEPVREYVTKALNESELSRQETKVKTGVDTGLRAVHPFTGELLPVWVADYVLGSYGTGAIMAVPAHDERDYEFAQAFNLPVKTVVEPVTGTPQTDPEHRRSIVAIVRNPKTGELLTVNWGKQGGTLFIGGGAEGGDADLEQTARREVAEETGYHGLKLIARSERIHHHYFAHSKGKPRQIEAVGFFFELETDERVEPQLEADEQGKFKVEWLSADQAERAVTDELHKYLFGKFVRGQLYAGYGPLAGSGQFDGLSGTEAKRAIVKALFDLGAGKGSTKYKLRDWIFSRQHYWGEPIPVIHCDHCRATVETEARTINFYHDDIWQALMTGRKTIETRALNPDEPDRYFGDIQPGAYIKAFNKNTGQSAFFRVSRTQTFRSWDDMVAAPDVFAKVFSQEQLPTTAVDFRDAYARLTPDYAERIERHGLVAWEFERVIPGVVPVPDDQLPVELPAVESYEPTDTGESPLAAITDWVNVSCPECGHPAKRETDTMPNWAGSSWYYLRYADAHNDIAFGAPDKLAYWTPVDHYNGGMEHTTLHLLYSRFWHKFLYDQGLVPTTEPYAKRTSHGMILGPDNQKMSKSRGNVINPDAVVDQYGADTIRLYEMFMGPFDEQKAWSEEHLNGVSRFLYRTWTLVQSLIDAHGSLPEGPVGPVQANTGELDATVDRMVHKTLKKVHQDIETMSFNTAVSALMELINFLAEAQTKSALLQPQNAALARRTVEALVLMVAPFTPHVAEELWRDLGYTGSVHAAGWPKYDPELIKEDLVTIVVQVNGKVRANLIAPVEATDLELTKLAQADENVQRHLEGKTVLKTVVISRKLVNFVVK